MDERDTKHLARLAQQVAYPPTPDIAAAVMALLRRPVWAVATPLRVGVALAIILVAAALAVPQVRGRVFDVIRIGAIDVQVETPPVSATSGVIVPATATPAPGIVSTMIGESSPAPRNPPDLAGETTLEAVEAQAGFDILLPTYPPDLGLPDHVYLQDIGGPVIVLVWVDEAGFLELAMHALGPGVAGTKGPPTVIEETAVNGQPALWTQGPYSLVYMDRGTYAEFLIEGHVLIWAVDEITYRLETAASLDYVMQIAESLMPLDALLEPVRSGDLSQLPWTARLAEQGVVITSIQPSKMEGYFYSGQHALWMQTNLGVMEVLYFDGEVNVSIRMRRSDGRYLYTFHAPSGEVIRMLDSVGPLYFTVVDELLVMTHEAELHAALKTIGQEIGP